MSLPPPQTPVYAWFKDPDSGWVQVPTDVRVAIYGGSPETIIKEGTTPFSFDQQAPGTPLIAVVTTVPAGYTVLVEPIATDPPADAGLSVILTRPVPPPPQPPEPGSICSNQHGAVYPSVPDAVASKVKGSITAANVNSLGLYCPQPGMYFYRSFDGAWLNIV